MNSLVQKLKTTFSHIFTYISGHKVKAFFSGIGLIIIVVGLSLLIDYVKNTDNRRIKFASGLYEKAHKLYFYGEGIDYYYNDDKSLEKFEQNQKTYYRIHNLQFISTIFSSSKTEKVTEFFEVLKIDENYYIRNFGRGISNYYGTTLKTKSATKKRIVFTAKAKFCEIAHQSNRGCESEEYYYTINKPFVIIKENGRWKIDEYTSVFEFSDEEIK